MLNTFHGTVDSDPMRIPAPASMQQGDDQAFAAELDKVTPRDPEPQPIAEAPTDIDDELAANAPEDTVADKVERRVASEGDDVAPEDLPTESLRSGARPATSDVTETQRRGETGRRETAGKGTDSPRTSSAPAAGEPLLDEMAAVTARHAQQHAPVAIGGTQGAAPAAGKAAGDALLRGIDATAAKEGGATARAVKPGYRTNPKATAEMLEQSRESIFKQIMLKISGDGGEMRIRLDPPSFGELDLRMTVEGGNRVSLAIAAQRDDLADLLQRHIAELTETLADAGLELTHADVQTRDSHGRDDFLNDRELPADHAAGDDTNDIQQPRRGGYIRADGLDFWA